jgi:hypothetical protein
MHGMARHRGNPAAGRLIADLESEFDLLRLERYMAGLEREDERLAGELEALRARTEAPVGAPSSGYALPSDADLTRRIWRALADEVKLLWLKTRREMLAEEWRRCSVTVGDIRFGLRVTGASLPGDE